MSQTSFQLKIDLQLPATGNPNKGYLLFPKDEFQLSYEARPNAKNKTLQIIVLIVDKDENSVWPLHIYNITQEGFITDEVINQDEINEYNVTLQNLNEQLVNLNAELVTLQETYDALEDKTTPEAEALLAQITAKQEEVNTVQLQISSLVPVQPVYKIENRYDDVIVYFNGDGTLTPEGIEWAKSQKLNGISFGDIVL